MEPTENQSEVVEQEVQSPSGVSFPTVGGEKKSGGSKTLLILGILLLVGILGFVIYKSASKSSSDVSTDATPLEDLTTPSSDQGVESITPAPSASPASSLDKSKVAIQVQNGTGITGEAGYLQTQLKSLGYTNVKVGNSDSTVSVTTVTFASSLDASVVAEITQKLNSIYQTVTTSTSKTGSFDVVIVTGLRKGATAKPLSTPTTVPSSSPSSTPTSTP